MGVGIKLSGGGGGGGAASIIKVADQAARLALTPTEGMVVLQLDTDELYEYDIVGGNWLKIGGIGTPLTFAGYLDPNGDLDTIPNWNINTFGGAYVPLAYTGGNLAGSTFNRIHAFDFALTPSANLVNDSFSSLNTEIVANGTFNVNDLFGVYSRIAILDTVDAGAIYGMNALIELGDGTNASTSQDSTAYNVAMSLNNNHTANGLNGTNANINMVAGSAVTSYVNGHNINIVSNITPGGGIQGVNAGFNIQAAITNGISAFYTNPQIDAAVNQFTGLQLFGYGLSAPTNYVGVSVNPNFSAATVAQLTGMNIGTTGDITDFYGINIAPGTGTNFYGLNMGLNDVYTNVLGINFYANDNGTNFTGGQFNSNANFTNFTGLNVNPSGNMTNFTGYSSFYSGDGDNYTGANLVATGTYNTSVTGVLVDFSTLTFVGRQVGLQVNSGLIAVNTQQIQTIDSFPGVVDAANFIVSNFYVAASGISDTDFLGCNLAGLAVFDGDYTSSGFFGLGWSAVGLVGQVSVANTRTADQIGCMTAGLAIPASSTGGTVNSMVMFRAVGALNAGGAITIDNLYAFRADTHLSDMSPTNLWGISIEDGNADNYFQKSLAVNTGDKKATAGNGLHMFQRNIYLDEGKYLGEYVSTDQSVEFAARAEHQAIYSTTGTFTVAGGGRFDAQAQVATGATATVDLSGVYGLAIRNLGATDNGILTGLYGVFGEARQINVGGAADTAEIAAFLGQVTHTSGDAVNLYDIFIRPGVLTGGTITGVRYGIYISQDDIGQKLNYIADWLSVGSNDTPEATLHVAGDMMLQPVGSVSTGTLTAYNAGAASVHVMTGAGAVTFQGIVAGPGGKILYIINRTGNDMTLANENAGAAANDRITTGTGADVIFSDNQAAALIYDEQDNRWQLIGAPAGGSALQGTRQTGVSISAGTTITPTVNKDTTIFVAGNAGPVTVTATPPVATTGMVIGQMLKIIGTHDTNTVTYDSTSNLVLNGSCTLAKDDVLTLMYAGTDGTNVAWVEVSRSN